MSDPTIPHLTKHIVENVLSDARVDSSGVSWDTIYKSLKKDQFERAARQSIDYGTCGIVIFLLKYYEKYKDDRLPEVIDLGIKKFSNYYKTKTSEIGFYNGRGGAIFTLVEANKILGDSRYLETAFELSQLDFHNAKTHNLENGLSGLLVGMLKLYANYNKRPLVKTINDVCTKIISGVKVNPFGIYWDELPIGMRPLNGFLYGNSGIIFSLCEAAKFYNRNSIFDNVIKEAITYEDHFFNKQTNNWPDFLNEDEFHFNFMKYNRLAKKKNKTEKDFYLPTNSFWWAVGSPGILLGRKDSNSPKSIESAVIEKILREFDTQLKRKDVDLGLYRGVGGVAMSLMHLGRPIDTTNLLKQIVIQKERYQEFLSSYSNNRQAVDLSLFRGETGIGYLLLSLDSDLTKHSSVLFPFIEERIDDLEKIPDVDVTNEILQNNFCLESNPVRLTNENFFETITRINKQKATTSLTNEEVIKLAKFDLKMLQTNPLYEMVKILNNYFKKNPTLPEKLSLSSNCKIVKTQEGTVLLKREFGEVETIELDDLQLEILSLCKGITISDLENNILKITNVEAPEDVSFVRERVKEETLAALKDNVLEASIKNT